MRHMRAPNLYVYFFSFSFYPDMTQIDSFLAENVNVAAVRKAYKIKDDEFRRFDVKTGVERDLARAVIARVSSKGISI